MSNTFTTKPKQFCFVLMPFSSEFDDIYTFGIKGACEDAHAYCERVDEQIYQGSMLERIYNQISRADLILADMTGKNPNVFYEVGYAHALGKPTILLTQDAADIPFDLKHFPHIVYGAKIKELRVALAKRIEWFGEGERMPLDYQIGLDFYYKEAPLVDNQVIIQIPRRYSNTVLLTLFNSASTAYQLGSFKVGLIAPGKGRAVKF